MPFVKYPSFLPVYIKGNGVAIGGLICFIQLYAKLVGFVWVVHFEAKHAFPGTSGFIKADIPRRCINTSQLPYLTEVSSLVRG